MDESWWASVLGEQEAQAPPTRPRPGELGIDRSNCPGSAEDWSWARELYESDDTVELPAIGYNRGGLLVQARGLRGFVPVSHLVDLPPAGEGADRSEQLRAWWGPRSPSVIEFNGRGRLVLSRRAQAVQASGRAPRSWPGNQFRRCHQHHALWVFVELGHRGLITYQLSWGRCSIHQMPSRGVSEIKVLSVDAIGERGASLKDLLPDPADGGRPIPGQHEIVEGGDQRGALALSDWAGWKDDPRFGVREGSFARAASSRKVARAGASCISTADAGGAEPALERTGRAGRGAARNI
jgi:small subunit ribosomal protein S1